MSNKALYAILYTACAQRANQHLGCSTNIRLGKTPCRRREGVVRNSVTKILPLGKSRNVKKLTDYDFEDDDILVETIALVQNRLGIAAVNDLQEAITPLLRIEWVDRELHQIGVSTVVTTNHRPVSLVDCVSFAVCRQLGVEYVFAFDPHFWEQGFQPLSNVA